MKDLVKKFTSRKFIVSLVGVITGLCGMLGCNDNIAAIIVCGVIECISIVAYIVMEGHIDAVSAGKILDTVVDISDMVGGLIDPEEKKQELIDKMDPAPKYNIITDDGTK